MRKESQSLKISNWLSAHATTLGAESSVLDLHETTLPMFDPAAPAENKDTILQMMNEADGFVFVSPEWNGMMSHGMANLMHYIGTEMANKPVMLVGVSAGRNGHYPVLQMRTMGYKNNHFVITPEALVVQDCNGAFNDTDMSDDADDSYLKSRADYALKILIEYSKALQSVRDSDVVDLETFTNGM